jgi:phage terminase large subunit-like protein
LRELSGLEGTRKKARPRRYYLQIGRKNGKTRLAAVLALVEACLKERRHIYCVSDSKDSVMGALMLEIRELIEGSAYLRDSVHIRATSIEVPETGSFIQAVANKYEAGQSINPHLVLFDEVHIQKTDRLWVAMKTAGAARTDALLLGVTTPGYQLEGLAHDLYEQVKAGTMAGQIWESDPALPIDDRDNWRAANPCYDLLPGFPEGMEDDLNDTAVREHEFRRWRLGQWTSGESGWLPNDVFKSLAVDMDEPPKGTPVYLGFDGSYSGDSTALMGCTRDGHLFVAGCWENPGKDGWRVPRDDVHATIEAAFEHWDVQRLVADPFYWESDLARWEARWGDKRVIEFRTNVLARMADATFVFYAAVMDGRITHSGDPRLVRHVANCVVKSTHQGDVITKVTKDSPNKIDLAVAAVLAHSEASIDVSKPRAPAFVL